MRLFIAINLPKNIKDYLRDIQAALRGGPEDKITLTRDFHCTLKFLGECSEAKKLKVEQELQDVIFEPFGATLENMGTFGRSVPRVIWVGLKVPDWLFETAAEIEKRMGKLGFEKERRFTPHITLARIRFLKNPKKYKETLKSIPLKPRKFPVRNFQLFESRLSPKGAHHTVISTFS